MIKTQADYADARSEKIRILCMNEKKGFYFIFAFVLRPLFVYLVQIHKIQEEKGK